MTRLIPNPFSVSPPKMTAGRTNAWSLSQHWCTPPHYVEAVRRCFGGVIGLDPCSNEHAVVHAEREYRLPDIDGLTAPWDAATIYVNPPYGRDRRRGTSIADWLKRCVQARRDYHAQVLALVPVATNTGHWKQSVWSEADGIAFLYDTRLRFWVEGHDGGKGAPMACAMIYWGDDFDTFETVFTPFGAVVAVRRPRIVVERGQLGDTSGTGDGTTR